MATAVSPGFLEDCPSCKFRGDYAFCGFSSELLKLLDRVSYAVTYPQRAVLFCEDQPCRGLFLLCSGKAKVTASRAGKPLMLRMAVAGEVLGLSAAISGVHYAVTAETTAPSVVRFVPRDEFLRLLVSSREVADGIMRALSLEYQQALESLRNLALLNTATARVAQLLLNVCSQNGDGNKGEATARFLLTQEQIAQMTATTRETVTRLLTQLKRERVISIRGSNLTIRDRRALERLAS